MNYSEPLPEPPQNQQTVAIYHTSANVFEGSGTMSHTQCWLRSAIILHNVTVDFTGRVVSEYNTTVVEINNDATYGDLYRQGRNHTARIPTVLRTMAIDLNSSVYFIDIEKEIVEDGRGSLGAGSIYTSRSVGDFAVFDPIDEVMRRLNSVYLRAAALSGLASVETSQTLQSQRQELLFWSRREGLTSYFI